MKMPGQGIIDRDEKQIPLNLARYKKGGKVFEVVVDADFAVELREGKSVDMNDVLQSENIFSDAKKGELASENSIKELFETDDMLKVAEMIIKNGEIQLTADYRKKLRDRKKNKIIEIIHRNGIDPRTNLPHPVARIESAMAEIKVNIEEFKKAEEQVNAIVKSLRPILPIKFEINEIAVKIPAEYAAKSYSVVKSSAKILKEEWLNSGDWVCVVEIAAGLRENFFNKINKATKGNVETKIIKTR